MCNRSIDIHGLTCFLFLLLRLHILKSTHVVQTVRKLHQDYTDVLRHSKKHLTQVLRLDLQLIRRPGQLSQLGNTINQQCHLRSKLLLHLVQSHDRIFYHIMQDTGYDRLLIQLQIRQNDGNTKRVNDIRLTRLSFLVLMGLCRNLICFFHHGNIIRRMVSPNTFNQILVQSLRACKISRIFQFNIHFFIHLSLSHRKSHLFCP